MTLNPLRIFRRRRRLRRAALEEAHYLRRRYGENAERVAREKLRRPDLTSWGQEVLIATVRLLRRRSLWTIAQKEKKRPRRRPLPKEFQ